MNTHWEPFSPDELEDADEARCVGCGKLVPAVRYDPTSMEYLCDPCQRWGQDMINQAAREAMEDL